MASVGSFGGRKKTNTGKAVGPAGSVKKRRRSRAAALFYQIEDLEIRRLLSTSTSHDGGAVLFPHSDIRYATPGTTTALYTQFGLGANAAAGSATPLQSTVPLASSLSPAQMRTAYGVGNITFGAVIGDGTGQTIAIVDAFDNPSFVSSTDPAFLSSDLHRFDVQYSIPDPPSFTKVDQTGGTNFPRPDPGGWSLEIALDVEWAHAIAPAARILLVEANTNFEADLFGAVRFAAQQPGVSVVSMSFGGFENFSELGLDSILTTPTNHAGVAFFAATGDFGAPGGYPAYSPNVIAVGGTELTISDQSGTYGSEIGWDLSGGGISLFEAQPTFQTLLPNPSATQRTIPDVSMDANTSVNVFDTTTGGGGIGSADGWFEVIGTSLSCPMWAALTSIADQGRVLAGQAVFNSSVLQNLLYTIPSTDFNDITVGNNFQFDAGVGYDLVTGRGTPKADQLVADLVSGIFISGQAWVDSNSDGIRQNTELPFANVTVDLFNVGPDGIVGTGDDVLQRTTSTTASGAYSFGGLAAGVYYVFVHRPPGSDYSPEHVGANRSIDSDIDQITGKSDAITIGTNPIQVLVDVGLAPNGIVIGDFVFNDLNQNGIQEVGEFGLTGVAVTLFSVGPDGIPFNNDDTAIASTTTLGGTYRFAQIDTGTYYIHFDRPAGYVASPKDQGGDDAKDSDYTPATGDTDPFTVSLQQKLLTEDAGMYKPSVSVGNISLPEGNAGSTDANFTLTMSAASDVPVTIFYYTVDASAVEGTDYTGFPLGAGGTPAASVTIAPGDTSATVPVQILGNTKLEPDKTFFFNLVLPTSPTALLGNKTATATILNDDFSTLHVGDAAPVVESPTGTVAVFTVSLADVGLIQVPSHNSITVNYTTLDGTGVAGVNYIPVAGTLTFLPGETTKTVVVPVPMPRAVDPTAIPRNFYLELTNPQNATLANVTAQATISPIQRRKVDFGGAVSAHYIDNSGNHVTITLNGQGEGHVLFLGTNASDGIALTLSGTNADSQLNIRTDRAGQQTSFVSIADSDEIGSIIGKTTNLTGNFTATGGLKQLCLNFVASGNQFTIGASSGDISSTNLQFGRVIDLSIASALPIRLLKLSSDNDSDGVPNLINAPAINSITTTGDFASDISLSGSLGFMNVGGALKFSHIRVGQNIGSITAKTFLGSTIFAGVLNSISGLPNNQNNFSNTSSTISRVVVRSKGLNAFSSTNIAAPNLGSLSLGVINTHNNGVKFGVAAELLASIRGNTNGTHTFALSNLAGAGSGFTQDDFVLSML